MDVERQHKGQQVGGPGPSTWALPLLGLACCILVASLHAQVPDWWITRGLVITNASVTNDYAPANIGQLKHAAAMAADELEATLPGGAGSNILEMVAAWTNSPASTNDFAPVNIGQLKATAKPFYDRIIALGGWTNGYPWTTNTLGDDADFAPANLGQLKHAFAFELTGLDSDVDGLPDWWEMEYFESISLWGATDDPDGDYLNNAGEFFAGAAPNDPDTDYDGRTDWQEIHADATSPTNAGSYTPVRLGYWRFNGGFTNEQGAGPLMTSNVTLATSWTGQAAHVTGPDGTYLRYRDSETNGAPNINLRRGTVRMWIRPDWTSASLGGTGPQTWSRIVETGGWSGDASFGGWMAWFDPDGNRIEWWMDPGEGGGGQTGPYTFHSYSGIAWRAEEWHQFALTYGETGIRLYLDGQEVASQAATVYYPDRSVRESTGLNFGGNLYGVQLVHGRLDEIETFNYPLDAPTIASNYVEVVSADTDSDGMPDMWEANHFDTLTQGASGDFDSDGLNNLAEFQAGSDPTNPDTDFDGTPDGTDSAPLTGDPCDDVDKDRVPYFIETNRLTNPNNRASCPVPDFLVDPVAGGTSSVDSVYTSIQAAINAGNATNITYPIISIKGGSYRESLLISGKRMLLQGELGSANGPVVIRGTNVLDFDAPDLSTITMESASVLDGVVITHLTGAMGPGLVGGFDYGDTTNHAKLINCVISGNIDRDELGINSPWGIYWTHGGLDIVHCTLMSALPANDARAFYPYAMWVGGDVRIAHSIIWTPCTNAYSQISDFTDTFLITNSIIRHGVDGGLDLNPGLSPAGYLTNAAAAGIDLATNVNFALTGVDIHGDPRPTPYGGICDIGADEWRDSDSDGLPDWAEVRGATTADGDADSDGLPNLMEFVVFGTDPCLADTDNDGTGDGDEDADGDWLSNAFEVNVTDTDPTKADSDNDGIWDGLEDGDQDGLLDFQEELAGSDPAIWDQNGDGLADGAGWARGYLPTDMDVDNDGLANADEITAGTDPFLADTDGDGVSDGDDDFPLANDLWEWPGADPGDTTPPVITLEAPPWATQIQ